MNVNEKDSILNSIKKMLGIDPDNHDFDLDILVNLNSSIFILQQNGIDPKDGFTLTNENQTYEDYLKDEDLNLKDAIAMYLFVRTKTWFDPPSSSIVMETYKQTANELLWRIRISKEESEDG